MKTTKEHDSRIANMEFSTIYPLYVKKVTNKGRSEEELLEVIEWLTGFNQADLKELRNQDVNFEEFFKKAKLNPNSKLIKGVICGYRVEELENPLTQKVRYLDKLVDELAKGKSMDKILRK